MVYDDDTGRRIHFEIRSEDRSFEDTELLRLPPPQVCAQIVERADSRGWGAERVHAWLRRRRHDDISLEVVRYVLNEARAERRP